MQATSRSPHVGASAGTTNFSVFAWLRKSDRYDDLERQVHGATPARPESAEYLSTVYFHWPAADLDEAKRIVDALIPVAKHPELILLQIMSRVYGQEFISIKDTRNRQPLPA